VTLIPGDGIGPEVARATVRLLEEVSAGIQWEELEAKPIVGRRQDDAHIDPVVSSILRNRVGLKGPITTRWASATAASTWLCARRSSSTPTFAP
jgi:isocitrate dehydrogenase (NAD+)